MRAVNTWVYNQDQYPDDEWCHHGAWPVTIDIVAKTPTTSRQTIRQNQPGLTKVSDEL